MQEDLRSTHASSTGQTETESGFRDAHFEACCPEYEAMLRSVRLQPGWSVLDAACGGGSHLPLIAEQVGPSGSITAFDLAPDNIVRVKALVAGWRNLGSISTSGAARAIPTQSTTSAITRSCSGVTGCS